MKPTIRSDEARLHRSEFEAELREVVFFNAARIKALPKNAVEANKALVTAAMI